MRLKDGIRIYAEEVKVEILLSPVSARGSFAAGGEIHGQCARWSCLMAFASGLIQLLEIREHIGMRRKAGINPRSYEAIERDFIAVFVARLPQDVANAKYDRLRNEATEKSQAECKDERSDACAALLERMRRMSVLSNKEWAMRSVRQE